MTASCLLAPTSIPALNALTQREKLVAHGAAQYGISAMKY